MQKNIKLTSEQQLLVENNLSVVHWVIVNSIHVNPCIQRFFFACSFARALTFARESITLKRGPNPVRRKEIIIHGDFG